MSTVIARTPFVSAIAGVSFHQSVVVGVHVGQELRVEREPDNPYDTNAYVVRTLGGDVLGHLPRAVAARMVDGGAGDELRGEVTERLTGGETIGLRVRIHPAEVARPAEPAPASVDATDGNTIERHVRVRGTGRVLGVFERHDRDTRKVYVATGNGSIPYPDALVDVDPEVEVV